MGFFTKHAHQRALEWYGLDLGPADMLRILKDCRSGTALLGKTNNTGHIYLARFEGKVVVPVLTPDKWLIITFLTPDYFVSGQQLRHHQSTGEAKQRASHGHYEKRPYQRERFSVRDAQEEL